MIVAHSEASAMSHKDCPKIVGLQSLLSHFDLFCRICIVSIADAFQSKLAEAPKKKQARRTDPNLFESKWLKMLHFKIMSPCFKIPGCQRYFNGCPKSSFIFNLATGESINIESTFCCIHLSHGDLQVRLQLCAEDCRV